MFLVILFFLSQGSFALSQPTLDQFLNQSVEKSFSVQSQSLETQAQSELVKGSTAWANPQLMVETQKGSDNTGSPIHNLKFSIQQPISSPWGLNARKRLAKTYQSISAHHLEDEILIKKVEALKTIFYYLSKIEILKAMKLRSERFDLLEKYISTRKHQSVQKSAESMIVSNKIVIMEKQIADLTIEIEQVWGRLQILLGVESASAMPQFRLKSLADLNKAELLQKLPVSNHEIELSHLEWKQAQQSHQLESMQSWPNFSFVAAQTSGRYGNVEDNYSLGVNISLPLFDWNRAKTKASEYQMFSREARVKKIEQEVKQEFDLAFGNYQVLRGLLLKNSIDKVQKLNQQMNVVVSGFKKGQVDILTFFEADASSFERLEYYWSLQSEYVSSVAELSLITGDILPLGELQ